MYSLPTPLIKRTSYQPSSYVLGQGYPLYLVIYNNQRMKITPNQMFQIFSKQSYQYTQRKLHVRKWNYRAQFIFENKNVRNQAIQLIKRIKEKYDVNCYYYFQRGHSTYSLMEQWEYRNAINLANTINTFNSNPITANQATQIASGNKRQNNQSTIQISEEIKAKNIEIQQNLMIEQIQLKKQSSVLSIQRQANDKKQIEQDSDKQQIEVQLEREENERQKIIIQAGSQRQKRSKHKKEREKDRQISVSIQIQRQSDRYMLQKQKLRDKASIKQKYTSKEHKQSHKNKISVDSYKVSKANVINEIEIFKEEQNKYRQKQKTKLKKQEEFTKITVNQSNLMNMQNSNLKSNVVNKQSVTKAQNFAKIQNRAGANKYTQIQEQEEKIQNESQKKINIIEFQIDVQKQPSNMDHPLNKSLDKGLEQNIMKQINSEEDQFVIPNQQVMQLLNNQQLITQILMLQVQIFNFCQ